MLRSERALEFFRQWLVYKIIIALAEGAGDSCPPDLRKLAVDGTRFVNELQTSIGKTPNFEPTAIAPAELLKRIEAWSEGMGRSRTVLLMDDAAHAFMQQQQREFFEMFRALRSRTVACKAAIYPGVTSYSPFFNVGHEAEEIEVWMRSDSSDYLETMRAIFSARFPASLQSSVRPELIDLAAYASFGLPRNFLNILSDSIGDAETEEDEERSIHFTPPTLRVVKDAIRANAERVRSLFEEISRKLPRYNNFITVGVEVQGSMIASIRNTNKQRSEQSAKFVGVAISQPWDADLTQVISLMEYAGALRRLGPVSRGRNRYEKVQLHTSLLIAENALGLPQSPSIDAHLVALRRQNADDFVRRQPGGVLNADQSERCQLNLSPCPVCQSPRISEDSVFCYLCGTALTEQSIYIELLSSPLESLMLTQIKLERILELTNLKTVQDVILDDAGVQLRTVPSIGKTWAARIKARADEFVTL